MMRYVKLALIAIGMIIAAFYIYQMVMFLSPATDLFSPK
jgi:hypothetical protein